MIRTNSDRPSWDEKFMMEAFVASTRSSCLNINAGAAIVKNKRMTATGYNGAPSDIKNSIDHGFCNKEAHGVAFDTKGSGTCRGEHAERNAMNEVSRKDLEGSTLYTTYFPCTPCAKTIIGNGIARVVYCKVYHEKESLAEKLFKEKGVQVDQMDFDPIEFNKYFKKLR